MSIHTDLDNKILNTLHRMVGTQIDETALYSIDMMLNKAVRSVDNLYGWAFVVEAVKVRHYKLLDNLMNWADPNGHPSLHAFDFGIVEAIQEKDPQGDLLTLTRFSGLLSYLNQDNTQRIFEVLLRDQRFDEIYLLSQFSKAPFSLPPHLRPQMDALLDHIIARCETYMGRVVDTIPYVFEHYQGEGREFGMVEQLVDHCYLDQLLVVLPYMHQDLVQQVFFRAANNTRTEDRTGAHPMDGAVEIMNILYEHCRDFVATFDEQQLKAVFPQQYHPDFWDTHQRAMLKRELEHSTLGAHKTRSPSKI